VAVVTVRGNHGLELGDDAGGFGARNAANIRAAAEAAVHWMNLALER